MTGAVSTAILQSSSATTVAAVGFVGAGLMSFPQALGIVFGANLEVTIGGYDLYYTEKKKDGWSIAKNLGPLVNSEETEFTPVFSKNGEWLYFTSERAGVVQDISGYDRAPGDFYRVRWKDVLEGLTE